MREKHDGLVTGIFRFKPTVEEFELLGVAEAWLVKEPENWIDLHIRDCSRGQPGLGFKYQLTRGLTQEVFFDRATDYLKRRFGNCFLGYDLSSPTVIVTHKACSHLGLVYENARLLVYTSGDVIRVESKANPGLCLFVRLEGDALLVGPIDPTCSAFAREARPNQEIALRAEDSPLVRFRKQVVRYLDFIENRRIVGCNSELSEKDVGAEFRSLAVSVAELGKAAGLSDEHVKAEWMNLSARFGHNHDQAFRHFITKYLV